MSTRNVPALLAMFESDLARVSKYPQTKRVRNTAAALRAHIESLKLEMRGYTRLTWEESARLVAASVQE